MTSRVLSAVWKVLAVLYILVVALVLLVMGL